jgi:hypothetical protein
VRGEERRLLGVGAEGRRDEQIDAVGAGGGGHAIEGQRDVRAHRLALALRERPPVLARRERTRVGVGPGRRELGLGGRRVGNVGLGADGDRVAHDDAHADRRQPAAGEGDADVVRAVARGGRACRVLAEREVLGALEVAGVLDAAEDRGLEDARVGVVHGAGGGQRGQVGSALQLSAHADAPSDPAQHDRAEHDCHEQPEHGPCPAWPDSPAGRL